MPGRITFRKLDDLRLTLFIGGCDAAQGGQMLERIDRRMNFIAFPTLCAVIAGSSTAFGRRLQGPAIK